MKIQEKTKSLIKTILLFTLFFTISAIPILLFKIDVNTFTNMDRVVYSLLCDFTFLFIIGLCYYKTLKKDFKPFFKNFSKNIETSLKYYLVGLAVMIVSNILINVLFKSGISTNEDTVRTYIQTSPFLMFLSISIYAPFAEELLFRKSIREVINNKWLYILASGLIFGYLHIMSTPGLIKFLYLIPYSSLGIAFAYTYYKTNNIYQTIVMHQIHNTITLILLLIGMNI